MAGPPTSLATVSVRSVTEREHSVQHDPPKQVHTGHPRDPRRTRPGGHLAEGAVLRDASLLEDDDPIRERCRLEGIVGHHQPHAAERCQVLAESPPQLEPSRRVDGGERFVEEQHARLGDQDTRECCPLRLATAERGGPTRCVRRQIHAREPFARLCVGGGSVDAPRAQPECDVVEHAQVRKEPVVLEDESNATRLRCQARVRRRVVEHRAVDLDVSVLDAGSVPRARAAASSCRRRSGRAPRPWCPTRPSRRSRGAGCRPWFGHSRAASSQRTEPAVAKNDQDHDGYREQDEREGDCRAHLPRALERAVGGNREGLGGARDSCPRR